MKVFFFLSLFQKLQIWHNKENKAAALQTSAALVMAPKLKASLSCSWLPSWPCTYLLDIPQQKLSVECNQQPSPWRSVMGRKIISSSLVVSSFCRCADSRTVLVKQDLFSSELPNPGDSFVQKHERQTGEN